MNRTFFAHICATCLFAFIGGFSAQMVLETKSAQATEAAATSEAAEAPAADAPATDAAAAPAENTEKATYMIGDSNSLSIMTWKNQDRVMQTFFDEHGQSRMDLGILQNQPVQNFYGDKGQLRLQLGTYPGEGEKGMPMMGFSDNDGKLKMLFRLAGTNQSPVIIMKDNQQRDRLIMGLGLNDGTQEPFLVTFNKDGAKTLVFGQY